MTAEASEFDRFADDYDRALERGLAVSGEAKDYFAAGRVAWLARALADIGAPAARVLDFGCGTGGTTPHLIRLLGAREVLGVDSSGRSLELARQRHGGEHVRFVTAAECDREGEVDVVYCNGVFHHIPPAERGSTVEFLRGRLRPGGMLALWENNPWNPGTRLVMRRIPFDRDAVTLTSREARRMVAAHGFEPLGVSFLFVFPRALRGLRALEPRLSRWPIGAQYQILARKPVSPARPAKRGEPAS